VEKSGASAKKDKFVVKKQCKSFERGPSTLLVVALDKKLVKRKKNKIKCVKNFIKKVLIK